MKQSRRQFVRTLFVATQAVVASRFIPGTLLAAAEADDSLLSGGYNFIIFGDWGTRGGAVQRSVAAQMALASKASKARFIIAAGDNFYNDGVTSITDLQWQSSFENIYRDPALQIPWHAILGNHDYHGNCDAQVEYGKTHLRWNMPSRYYKQTHHIDDSTTADFFYIDTMPLLKSYQKSGKANVHDTMQDPEKQIVWLKDALAASRAQWKIAIGHHPIYSGGIHGDTPELIERILPLLLEYKVQVWLNGHDHDLQHLSTGDLNMFCSGAGASSRRTKETTHTKFAKSTPGFTTISLRADRMNVLMTASDGRLLYSTTVPVKPA